MCICTLHHKQKSFIKSDNENLPPKYIIIFPLSRCEIALRLTSCCSKPRVERWFAHSGFRSVFHLLGYICFVFSGLLRRRTKQSVRPPYGSFLKVRRLAIVVYDLYCIITLHVQYIALRRKCLFVLAGRSTRRSSRMQI